MNKLCAVWLLAASGCAQHRPAVVVESPCMTYRYSKGHARVALAGRPIENPEAWLRLKENPASAEEAYAADFSGNWVAPEYIGGLGALMGGTFMIADGKRPGWVAGGIATLAAGLFLILWDPAGESEREHLAQAVKRFNTSEGGRAACPEPPPAVLEPSAPPGL